MDVSVPGFPEPLLSVTLTMGGADVAVLTLTGELDHSNVADARQQLDGLLRSGVVCILLDLRQLTFMDSSGVNLLLYAYHLLMQRQGTLALIEPSPPVYRLLSMVRLASLVPIYPSVQRASADLAGRESQRPAARLHRAS